ncbi:SOS-response transcriptional repressor, LexA [Geobacter sp. DSM 9736]|nr:SOS-response transcriptional repressor, LexA [Geobacter sp. DSM 9736]
MTLTTRQKQVLDFVTTHLESNGYPPTLREVASHLQVSGTNGVLKHLDALERKGLIRRHAGSSRGMSLTGISPALSLPIVGTVKAGLPQTALEEIEGYLSVDRSMVSAEGCFFLRVKGDSMINAAIIDGDLALVRPQQTAQNRDIVVAMTDGEATLKRFYRGGDHIRLQPENPNMAPIIIRKGEDISIIGKVIGVYRHL